MPGNVPTTWTWEAGTPTFSVQLAAVAVNNLDGTIGTPVRIPSVKAVMTDVKTITDQAQGDSKITAIAAQLISADLTIDTAGITFAAYTIMTGVTQSSSTVPTRSYLTYSNDRMPYFALILEALGAEDAGDELVFLPKCKITTGFSWKFEFAKIITPQIKALAIPDLVLGDLIQIVKRPVIAAITMPPS